MELNDGNESRKISSDTRSSAILFFRRWLTNPQSMGTFTTSSESLCRHITRNILVDNHEIVVEFGGGTGALTQALLASSVPATRIFTLERDTELAGYLSRRCPTANIIEGDAMDTERLIPESYLGKVGTAIVGIPTVTMPLPAQKKLVDMLFRIMSPGRRFLLYTYWITSPLPLQKLGLVGKRLAWTPFNLPPASLWAYHKA